MRFIAKIALLAVTLLVCIPLIRGPGDSKGGDALPSVVDDYVDTPIVLKLLRDGNRVVWSARSSMNFRDWCGRSSAAGNCSCCATTNIGRAQQVDAPAGSAR